jgi:hypothetical protein
MFRKRYRTATVRKSVPWADSFTASYPNGHGSVAHHASYFGLNNPIVVLSGLLSMRNFRWEFRSGQLFFSSQLFRLGQISRDIIDFHINRHIVERLMADAQ